MAIARGQTDRFGNPIPANPGYKIFVNSDGSVLQQREIVLLDQNVVASDVDSSQATQLSIGSATGNAPGRMAAEFIIDEQTVTGTSYSATWTANKYRSLRFTIKVSAGTPLVTATLTGIASGYTSQMFYYAGGIGTGQVTQVAWSGGPSAPGHFNGRIECESGFLRTFDATFSQTSAVSAVVVGDNTNTASDVTGFALSLNTSSTFNVCLYGVLS